MLPGVRFPPAVTLGIQVKEFNLASLGLIVSKRAVMCLLLRSGFVWPFYHKGLIGGVLQRWLSFWKVGLPKIRYRHFPLSYLPKMTVLLGQSQR
jgi:hypothetical protein